MGRCVCFYLRRIYWYFSFTVVLPSPLAAHHETQCAFYASTEIDASKANYELFIIEPYDRNSRDSNTETYVFLLTADVCKCLQLSVGCFHSPFALLCERAHKIARTRIRSLVHSLVCSVDTLNYYKFFIRFSKP